MNTLNRRNFVKLTAGTGIGLGALGVAGFPLIASAQGKAKARVVVVGGGYGGAICAKYIKLADSSIDVTLLEKNETYYSCPFSNEVIAGHSEMADIAFNYDGLAKHGVKVIIDEVTGVDGANKSVSTKGGNTVHYDMLVVSPGVSFRKDAIEGYDAAAEELMPHAWKQGPQTLLLRKQLENMKDGGVVMISAPPNPFRCPPGPYERAAQIASYLKHHKPKSKVIVMDSKSKFSKQGLFMEGWEALYPGMIEWRSSADDGKVVSVDAAKGIVSTEFDDHEPAVANIIPPQQAHQLAVAMGLADDSGWCPVDQGSFESSIHKDIYVIGDSCIAGKMPKSGYAANTQAKVCAAAIVAKANGRDAPTPAYTNTCYSLIGHDYGISVAAVYQLKDGKIGTVNAGLSPVGAPASRRKAESIYARSWFRNITADMFT